jgi:putative PIN family toxin of toxin-antitoxin system
MTARRVDMVRVVLDTNVLISSISYTSPFHWVWKSFIEKRYELCVTTDILVEDAEVIERYFTLTTAEYILEQIMLNKNTVPVIRYFEWNIIEKDADDNKFFDCAVATNADYLVTEDKHFNVLKNISFPSVTAIKAIKFQQVLDSKSDI